MTGPWSSFWFASGPIHVLGVLRIVMVTSAMVTSVLPAIRLLPTLATRPAELFHSTGFHLLTGWSWPPDPASIPWISAAAMITGLTACLGLATRISLVLVLVFYLFLAGGLSSLGIVDHISVLTTQVLLVLVVAPGSTAWSLDALLAGRHAGRPLLPSMRGEDGERWGIQLILILIASTYLLAGIAKLRWGGLAWLDGHTLAWYLSGQAAHEFVPMMADPAATSATAWRDGIGLIDHAYFSRKSSMAAWIAGHQPLPMLLALGAVAFECTAWLLLIPRFRNWILLSAVSFHLVISQLMGHGFWPWQLLCLVMVDWPALGRTLDRALRPLLPQPAAVGGILVFYDGVCGLCDATVTWALAADQSGRMRFATLQGSTAQRMLPPELRQVPPDSIIVIEAGQTRVRSDAILAICAQLGGLYRLVALLRFIPRPLRDGVYTVIAHWRYAWFGQMQTCRLPSPAERARFLD